MGTARGQHLIGRTLGSCILERLLGYGGSSAVFLARQLEPERKVAVKVFLPRPGTDAEMQRDFYQRFLYEAEAASQLDHENILPIYAYGEEDGLPYIVMPYMPGGTLSEYIARHGPLSLQEAQWYLQQIASALDYAHTHNCVHCDVKAANILLDADGHALLSDFGIARMSTLDESSGTYIPRSPESLMGTPDYLSPEQALGQPLDGRSDVYSLGVTLFYMLSKRLPFKADTTIALVLLHVHEPPPSLALLRPDVSPELDDVVRKAMAKDPEQRFQRAGDLYQAFAAMVESSGESSASGVTMRHARTTGNAAALVADDPIVRVKMLPSWHWSPLRIVAVAVICVMLVSTLRLTSYVILLHNNHTQASGQNSVALTVNTTTIDYLTLRNKWPLSNTFFYDKDLQRYHVVNKSLRDPALALYDGEQFHDFRLSVTASQIKAPEDGINYYGIVFRVAADQSHYYLFEVTPDKGGEYVFYRSDGQWSRLAGGPAPSLQVGVGKSNTLTVEARGNTFAFSINGKSVGKAFVDSSSAPLMDGHIGLYVEDQGTEVAFSHLYIEMYK